jgi:Xaa-Pro aminopeptidase
VWAAGERGGSVGINLGREVVAEKHRLVDELLPAAGFDAWLVFTRETMDPICPLVVGTRFVGLAAFLFTECVKIAVCADYDAMALERLDVFDRVVPYSLGINEPLANVLRDLNSSRIGVNYSLSDDRADGLSHGLYLALEEILEEAVPGAQLVSAEKLVQSVRARKTQEEIRRIRGAIEVADRIFREMVTFICPGRTEMDIGLFAKQRAEDLGARLAEDSLPIVATGKAGLGHRSPSDAVVTAGDVVVIDLGVCLQGYHSDFARTFFVPESTGTIPPSLTYRLETARDAIALAHAMIRPGGRGYEPKEATDQFIRDRGIAPPRFALGHQVGTACHDGGVCLAPRTPRYRGRAEGKIEQGNVFTLEPFLVPAADEDELPVGIEEMILVTEDGCEWLTSRQVGLWTTESADH